MVKPYFRPDKTGKFMTRTLSLDTNKQTNKQTNKLVQQEFGGFSMDLVIGYKVFFLMDSCSIGIVFQESG